MLHYVMLRHTVVYFQLAMLSALLDFFPFNVKYLTSIGKDLVTVFIICCHTYIVGLKLHFETSVINYKLN